MFPLFFFHALKEYTPFTLNVFSLMLATCIVPPFSLNPVSCYYMIMSLSETNFLKKMQATADKKHIFFYLFKTILILLHKSSTAVTI